MKKLLFGLLLLFGIICFAPTTEAIQVGVPQATTTGQLPVGKSSGNYTLLNPGADNQCLTASSSQPTGLAYAPCGGGGSGTPQGNNTDVQFNSSGSFGGSDNFTWINATNRVGINSTTPIAALTVLNKPNTTDDILRVSSSTGANYLVVGFNGSTTLSSLGAGLVRTTALGNLYTDTSAYLITVSANSPLGGNGTAGSPLTCATCLTSAITSISALTGPAISIATSSDTNILLSINTSTANTLSFVPGWSGVLAPARGGTGTSTAPTYPFGQLLLTDGLGTKYAPTLLVNTATHSWGTSTPNQLTANVLKVPNAVTFNSSGGAAANSTFDGSGALTVDYHTVGAQVSGTYLQSLTGGGTTTGTTLVLASSSPSTDWNIVCSGSVCTFDHPNNLQTTLTLPLAVNQGGTGNTAVTAGDILYGNGTSPLATSSLFTFSTGSGLTVNATSTLATTTDSGTLTVTGSTTLSSLGAGCVNSTAQGALFVNTCASGSGITSISALTGPAIAIATSSDTNILISVNTSTANTLSFVPGWSGNLAISRGGTGTTTWISGSIPFYNGTNFTEQNTKLFWDNSNTRLGVGSGTPTSVFALQGTGNNTTDLLRVATSTGQIYLNITSAGNVGINSSSPQSDLTIQGSSGGTNNVLAVASSSAASLFQIGAQGFATFQPTATSTTAFLFNNIQGNSILSIDNNTCNPTDNCFTISSSTGVALLQVNGLGNVVATGTVTTLALIGKNQGSGPTIATGTGIGVGTAANITASLVYGDDISGFIHVKTASGPLQANPFVIITFIAPFPTANPPNCQWGHASGTATSLPVITSTSTATTVSFVPSSAALTATTTYDGYYNCFWH